jgi:hypothetical protein
MMKWSMKSEKPDFVVEINDKRIKTTEKSLSFLTSKIDTGTLSEDEKAEYKKLETLLHGFKKEAAAKKRSIEFFLKDDKLHTLCNIDNDANFFKIIRNILTFQYCDDPYRPGYSKLLINDPTPRGLGSFVAYIPFEIVQAATKYGLAGQVSSGGKDFVEAISVWFYKHLAELQLDDDIYADKRIHSWFENWRYQVLFFGVG